MKPVILLFCALLAASYCSAAWGRPLPGGWARGWEPTSVKPLLGGDTTLLCIADNFVNETFTTQNNGGKQDVQVGRNPNQHGLFYYDLTSLVGLPVTLALCSLYTGPASGHRIASCFLKSGNWVEGTATGTYQYGSSSWNVRGFGLGVTGDSIAAADSLWEFATSVPSDTVTISQSDVWVVFDVTTLISYMVGNPAEWCGLVLRDMETTTGTAAFVSSEGNPSRISRLYIEWAY